VTHRPDSPSPEDDEKRLQWVQPTLTDPSPSPDPEGPSKVLSLDLRILHLGYLVPLIEYYRGKPLRRFAR
ncbi:hypothetical protein U1Q18_004993, partial [Sarracenia purpurea var. burkii]